MQSPYPRTAYTNTVRHCLSLRIKCMNCAPVWAVLTIQINPKARGIFSREINLPWINISFKCPYLLSNLKSASPHESQDGSVQGQFECEEPGRTNSGEIQSLERSLTSSVWELAKLLAGFHVNGGFPQVLKSKLELVLISSRRID